MIFTSCVKSLFELGSKHTSRRLSTRLSPGVNVSYTLVEGERGDCLGEEEFRSVE